MINNDIKERDILIKQNEAIIALLARSTIGMDAIYQAIVAGKKNPTGYVRAYNALDGKIGVTDAAKIAGVSQPTMTPILKDWEARGIVYNVGDSRRPLYKRLLSLPDKLQTR